MHNRIGFNRLSRKAAHRNAMIRNMVTSLFRYERIITTKAKALEVKKVAEKMITRAKIDSVHNRRIVNKDLKDAEILNKLFTEIGPEQKDRPGGYTRIIKKGLRQGDAAEMVILEIVKDENKDQSKNKKKKKPAEKKKDEKAKDSIVEEPKVEKIVNETTVTEEPKKEVLEETSEESTEDDKVIDESKE